MFGILKSSQNTHKWPTSYMERKKHPPTRQDEKLPTLSRFQITFFLKKKLGKYTILCSQALGFLKTRFLCFLNVWKFENGKPMPRSFLTFTEKLKKSVFFVFFMFCHTFLKAISIKSIKWNPRKGHAFSLRIFYVTKTKSLLERYCFEKKHGFSWKIKMLSKHFRSSNYFEFCFNY